MADRMRIKHFPEAPEHMMRKIATPPEIAHGLRKLRQSLTHPSAPAHHVARGRALTRLPMGD